MLCKNGRPEGPSYNRGFGCAQSVGRSFRPSFRNDGLLLQIPQCNHATTGFLEMLHVFLELLFGGVDPGMLDVGNSVKGEDDGLVDSGFGNGFFELLKGGTWLSIKGLW